MEHVEDEALLDSLSHRIFVERAEARLHLRVGRADDDWETLCLLPRVGDGLVNQAVDLLPLALNAGVSVVESLKFVTDLLC